MSLEQLYDRWADRLLGYLVALLRDRDLAVDALQELFAKLAARGTDGITDEAAYMYRAARNEAGRLRSRERPLAELHVVAAREGSDVDTSTLAAAIDALPRPQAEAVILHALEGMTFAEVGQVMGTSLNTAASRYRYALERLRELLKCHSKSN